MAFWTDAIGNMGSLGAYKKCKTLLLQKHHNSSDFLDITKPTLEKTHTRATKTSLAKTLQKWYFYEFGPIPERTLTRATLATNLLLLKHHQSAVFLEFVTKMKVFWHKYLIGPIQERTLTLATFATNPSVAQTSPKWCVLRVWNENRKFISINIW